MPADSYTYQDGASAASEYSAIEFIIRQALSRVRTATMVKVLAVTNSGGLSPVGTVDVQPLVQQVDGQGKVVNMPPLYGLPYLRIQGGANAIVIDPEVGDIGLACFADRDQSAAMATKDMAPPGSMRRHSLADGFFVGGFLNAAPTQFIQFNSTGITVHSPHKVIVTAPEIDYTADNKINLTAPNIKLDGAVEVTGAQTNDSTITASGEVKSGSIGLQAHHHTAQGATAPTTPAQP